MRWNACVGIVVLGVLFNAQIASASVTLGTANTSALTNGLVGYWTLDGKDTNWRTNTTADASGNGNTGSLIGLGTTTAPTIGRIGQALKFNGTSSYLQAADSASLDISGSFSAAFWLNASTWNNGASSGIISKKANDAANGYVIYDDGSTNCSGSCGPLLNFRIGGTSGSQAFLHSASPVAIGVWQHWSVVYDSSAQTVRWYKNGTLDKAYTSISTGDMSNAVPFQVGRSQTWNGFLNGKLDDVRIYNRAISASEVALLYATGNANVGHANSVALNNGLKLHWSLDGSTITWASAFSGTVRDLSGNGSNGTIRMGRATSSALGKVGQAAHFDGLPGGVMPLTGTVTGSITDFALSFWQYADINSSGSIAIIPMGIAGASFYTLNGNDAYRYVNSGFDCSPNTFGSAAWADYTTRWRHLVVMRSGSTLSVYRDGAFAASCTSGTTAITNPVIAAGNFFTGRDLIGRLDEVRFYNRALSTGEISALYKLGTVNIAHSNTSPQVGLNSGLVGHWTFDGGNMNWKTGKALDSSGNANDGALIALGTTTSPTIGKIGQALKFNGTGQYVSLGTPANLNFSAASAISVCAWTKLFAAPTASGGYALVGKWSGTGSAGSRTYALVVGGNSTTYKGIAFFIQRTGASGAPNFSMSNVNPSTYVGSWRFFCGTWNGTTITTYDNGVAVGTPTSASGTLDTSAVAVRTGQHSDGTADNPNFSLDDVRVYNRALSPLEVQQLYLTGK